VKNNNCLHPLFISGVGVFFSRQDAGLLPAKPDSGNCLAFYCRLFKTFRRSSCRGKNTPTPHLFTKSIAIQLRTPDLSLCLLPDLNSAMVDVCFLHTVLMLSSIFWCCFFAGS
jgi:hypothetical protein